MKKHLSLLLMIGCLALARAQNPINCLQQQLPPAPARPASMGNCLTPIDDEVALYVPTASMPTLTYNVNFVFLVDQTLPTVYSNCSLALLTADADSMIAYCNRKFAACGSVMPSLGSINPSPLVANPKIRLRRNNVYKPISPLAIGNHFGSDSIYKLHAYDTSVAMNIYFYTETDTAVWSGGEAFINKGFGYMTAPPFAPQYTNGVGGYPYLIDNKDLFWHELCHLFGHLADHYMNDLSGNGTGPYTVRVPNNSDPAIIGSNANAPILYGGYFPDDAAPDSTRFYNCNNPLDTSNNNVMGNSFCRQFLSARQIAAFHYLVAKNKTKKYTQYNGLAYPYTPSYPTPVTVNLSGTQNLYSGSIPYFSLLTIQAGASITINNANIRIPYNGKIVIEPGAKLTLNCTALSLAPNQQPHIDWFGVEVWGQATASQTLNASGRPLYQGMLVLNNSVISGAKIAVLAGKRYSNNNFSFASGSGGGIIIANNSTFVDNTQAAVHMLPRTFLPSDNLSTFTECQFTKTREFMTNNGGLINAMVDLEGVDKIKFYGNYFAPQISILDVDTTIGIRGTNASIIVNSSQGSTNEFDSTYYAIYLTGGKYSRIEDCNIFTRNGIYLSNNSYSKIVRNTIRLDFMPNGVYNNELRTGIYLSQCTNFKVEKNNIAKVYTNNGILAEGICVDNSGPVATQLYNNTFSKLYMGVWCQNQNYDPASLTNDGLKINCNDFNLCTYNIGVQTPLISEGTFTVANYIYGNWQSNFSQQCFNGGIAKTQGISNQIDERNVRNTYKNVQGSGNENKFYSFTPYSNPPQVQHGNFKEPSSGPIYKVGPQPLFSDSLEVLSISGINPVNARSIYCPDLDTAQALRPASFTNIISGYNLGINTLLLQYNTQLDRNNTNGLLSGINSSMATSTALRDTLVAQPFLSDTVLASYFTNPAVAPAHIQDVFIKNAPVNPRIWQLVEDRGLPSYIADTLATKQYSPTLSARSALLAQLSIAKNERSYAIMHKSMAFMGDSTATHVKDSIASLIILNNQGDVKRQLIELDFNFADYTAASTKLGTYTLTNTSQQRKYVDFKNLLITIMQDSLQLRSLIANSTNHASVTSVANDYDHPCMQEARNILFSTFNRFYPEQKLVPQVDDGAGSRTQAPQQAAVKEKMSGTAAGLYFYPNPAGNEFFISNAAAKEYSYTIVNVNGQVLLQGQIKPNGLYKIDTGSLINGIYFVNLYEGKSPVKTSKLVVVK